MMCITYLLTNLSSKISNRLSKRLYSNDDLLYVSSHNDPERLELAIKAGADVNKKYINGDTPLHIAAKFAHGNIRTLINAGANIDAKNDNQKTPLQLAVEIGNYESVKLLIQSGADFNQELINDIFQKFPYKNHKYKELYRYLHNKSLLDCNRLLSISYSSLFEKVTEEPLIKILNYLSPYLPEQQIRDRVKNWRSFIDSNKQSISNNKHI